MKHKTPRSKPVAEIAAHPDTVLEVMPDAQFLATAPTAEQREAMGMKRDDAAVWSSTPEGLEAERREKKAALARYREKWGREPV